MIKNQKQFFKSLDKQEKKIKDSINDVLKDVTEEIFNALLESKSVGGTPKITGLLRSNYIITTNNKFNEVVGDKKNVSTSKREGNLQNFLADDELFNKLVIYINNNTPYGSYVDAVQNFRERALVEGVKRLSKHRVIK